MQKAKCKMQNDKAPRRTRRRLFCLLPFAFCLALSGCAAKRISLPTDAGGPFPDFAAVHAELSRVCSGVRTLTAELSMSGRAGDQKLRGRVHAGFERPSSMRLEGVAPFGPPAFILVARGGEATLLLPRDERVVRGAKADDILGALTGVSLAPADLQAILTGCVVPAPRATAGRLHAGGWGSIDLDGGPTLFLQRQGQGWRLRAARRGPWQVEYTATTGALPSAVALHADDPVRVDLNATIGQVETNVDLDAAAFSVTVPRDAAPLSLDALRASGPLRESQ
jgi:outer membrane lipoprotein-sorting protein